MLEVILAGFVACPDTNERTYSAQKNAPSAEPVTVIHECAEPSAKRTAQEDTDGDSQFHNPSLSRLCSTFAL